MKKQNQWSKVNCQLLFALCLILLTAMTALADQKKISRADIAEILNRPDILKAEDVVTYGNKIVIIDWGVDENDHRYLEAISLPADKVRNIGNSVCEHDQEDSGQDNDSQIDTEENDPYLEEVKRAFYKARRSKSINDIIAAKDMLMSTNWDCAAYDSYKFRLLFIIEDIPNVYSIYTDLISYAIQQPINVAGQHAEIHHFIGYVEKHDQAKANKAIDFLNSLLDTEWQNPEAKEFTEDKIKKSIKYLKELQEK